MQVSLENCKEGEIVRLKKGLLWMKCKNGTWIKREKRNLNRQPPCEEPALLIEDTAASLQ